MSTLVIVEHNNQEMHPSTSHVVAAAKQLNENVILLVVGFNCDSVALQAAIIEGVEAVWLVNHQCYEHQLAANISELVVAYAATFTSILVSSSTFGKDLLPRVAAKLDIGQVSDVTRIIDKNTFEHPIYAGNALETVRVLDDKKALTIRTTAFDAIGNTQSACCIEHLDKIFISEKTEFLHHQLTESTRPELANAKIVIAGGRGLQSMEQFKLIEELADVLGAAVGASRAAVDAGFAPNDSQVGQTGKVVAPELYIAVGISGAVQHLAGMKDSKVIVAINKDADAPIFQIADYGLIGDLFELVPQFIEQYQKNQN